MKINFSQIKIFGDEIKELSNKKNTIILEKMNLRSEYNGLVTKVNKVISNINFLEEEINNLVFLI
jgi:hypothetical protein